MIDLNKSFKIKEELNKSYGYNALCYYRQLHTMIKSDGLSYKKAVSLMFSSAN